MPTPEIQEFAKLLVQSVRDAAVKESDLALRPDTTFPKAKRWRALARAATPEAFAQVIIADVVDETIFCLLRAIDDGSLKVNFTSSSGKTVDLENEGLSELGGWFMGSGGWREQFAKERYVDDFKDLKQ